MLIWATFDQNSVIVRVKILDSAATTGAGKTGLTSASAGLIVSAIADSEAAATVYTVAAGNVETITTLGTYAAPTANKCRFKEVDATNHPGIYELQFADARFGVAGAKSLLVSVSGASGAAQCDAVIPLPVIDLFAAATPANVTQLLGTAWLTPAVAGTPDVNVKLLSGDSVAADNAEAFFDGTGYAGTGNTIPTVTTTTNLTNLPSIPANWLTAAGTAADFGAEIADSVWDEILSEHLVAGSAGKIVGDNLNAAVSSRMASYTQPSGFLAATFPAGTVASTTNITAGTVASVTNDVGITQAGADKTWSSAARSLTDKSGFALSAAGVQAIWDALTSALVAAGSIGKKLADLIVQSGDAFARLGAPAGASVSADVAAVKTDTDTLTTRLSAVRAGYLDNLNSGVPLTAAERLAVADALFTRQMVESYAANGAAPTHAQALFAIHQMLMQFGISGTALTVRKLDNTTTAFVVTLDSATAPTDAKRV